MFNNQLDKNVNQQNNNTTPSLFDRNAGGLFSKPAQTPASGPGTGGLFGSVIPGNSLFSLNNNPSLKTSQRKQGGLFGSVNPTKAASIEQAPKLNFGTYSSGGSNSLFSSNQNSLFSKKQQSKPTLTQVSTNPTTTLFSRKDPVQTGSLFGSTTLKTQNMSKQQAKSQTPTMGLFSGTTPPDNKPKDQSEAGKHSGSLFGSGNTNSLFSNANRSSVFSNNKQDKKQTTPSFGSNPQSFSPSFSNVSPQGSTTTGNIKTQTQKTQAPGGLFNVNPSPTPNTPLFGPRSSVQSVNVPQQVPKFSLGGNAAKQPQLSGLFFNKTVRQATTSINQGQSVQLVPRQALTQLKPTFGLFAGPSTGRTNQKTQGNTGSLFGANTSLFNASKTQTTTPQSGSLFSLNKQPSQKPQESKSFPQPQSSFPSASGQGQPSPFNKNQTDKKEQTSQLNLDSTTTKQTKAPESLASNIRTNNKWTSQSQQNKQSQRVPNRQTRTISFSEPQNQNTQKRVQKCQLPMQDSMAVKSRLLAQSGPKPQQASANSPSVKQSVTGRPVAQQVFFKTEHARKQPKQTTIFTAFQINKLMKESLPKQSATSEPRNPSQSMGKESIKSIEEWIQVSFRRFNQIPTSQMVQSKYLLHANQDINKFLNDVVRQVVLLVNLPLEQSSFKLVNKLFQQLIAKLGVKQYLFNCTRVQLPRPATNPQTLQQQNLQIVQLNTSYFIKHQIYTFTPEAIQLNLESVELQQYILCLAKKFITNQLQYLEYIQNKVQMLRLPHCLFFSLLSYCLQYRKSRLSGSNIWNHKCTQLVVAVQDFQRKIIRRIVACLSNFLDLNFYSFSLINKLNLPALILQLQDFSYTEQEDLIDLALKVILNNMQLAMPNSSSSKVDVSMSPQLKSIIRQTKSLQLLPFRTLISILENNTERTAPSSHDLYRYINGPEWLDWLQIYLNNGNGCQQKQVPIAQARYLSRILRYTSLGTQRGNRQCLTPKQMKFAQNLDRKILSRKRPIYKFIMALKEENMLSIFYEILISLAYDYDSYRKIQDLFFKQKQEFNYEFRNVIAQIANYPTHKFKEQIPFIQEKVLYFLRIVEIAPQRTLALQKLIFDGEIMPSKKLGTKQQRKATMQPQGSTDAGHKICHLIIDAINYFSLRNNQRIVGKCISAIRSLLQNDQTSSPMKIAMAVNKPQIVFITSDNLASSSDQTTRLSQVLVYQMTQLLQYFLVGEEFIQMIAVHLRTNNSQDVHLENMYSVRYSDKDYLPFAKHLINQQQYASKCMGKVLSSEHPTQQPIILTYSSYWFFKTLQVLVQAIKQQKISASSNDKSLLYLLNLIIQKFLIPFSHSLDSDKLQDQQPNNPIYPTSCSNQIPKILLYLVQALNTIDMMGILSQNLKYKLLRSGHIFDSKSLTKKVNYCLTNQKLQEDYSRNQQTVFLSVKILKQLLETYRIYEQYKNAPLKCQPQRILKDGQGHFVYKLLTRLKWMQQLQFCLFLNSYAKNDLIECGVQGNGSKTNMVIGLVTLLLVDSRTQGRDEHASDSSQSKPVNLKQQNYQKPYIVPIEGSTQGSRKPSAQLANFPQIQNFYVMFGDALDYEAINNFLINSPNLYLENYQSLQCLSIQCLSLLAGGQCLLGDQSANRHLQSSINISKYLGLYNIADSLTELFSNTWLLQNLQNHLCRILAASTSSLQIKQAILQFLYQIVKCDKTNSNFLIAKKVFYKYLGRHLGQFSLHSDEQINRLNLHVIKILNILQSKDHYIFSQQVNDKLLDCLLLAMLQSCHKCLKSSTNLLKLIRSFQSKEYYPSQLAYYHLQRTVEQRQIVKSGQAYHLLKQIVQIVERRFFDPSYNMHGQIYENAHRWKCIRKISHLVISLNLSYLTSTVMDNNVSRLTLKQLSTTQEKPYFANTRLPRSFNRNPLEVYITEARCFSSIYSAFDVYKQNVINWLSFYSVSLGEKVLRFLNWILTVDNNLYGNQPVSLKSRQLQSNKHSSIICSLHMGSYKHSAVELFADTESQAVNMVKNLYAESISNLQKGMTVNQTRCFSVMGYCLEWIRARSDTSDILGHLVQKTVKNPFWLDHRTAQNTYAIKFLLSVVSIGKQSMSNGQFRNIRGPILDLIHNFKSGKSQLQQTTIQELISVLISIPPQIEDHRILNQILQIWSTETNNQFFYNQSRLVLELCWKHPNQVVKFKALSSCQKLKKADFISQYSYSLRDPDCVGLTWGLKIASCLMSTEVESVVVIEEASRFYAGKSEQVHNFLLRSPPSITLAYLQELQALLQFLITLVSSQSWLVTNRQQFQKLTYILSHKLIHLFTDFINSKIVFIAESDMQRRFRNVRHESYIDHQNYIMDKVEEYSLDKDSVFKMFMQIKMMESIKTYTLLLSRCFEQSWYVHKFFNEEVFQNYRYGVSFWDRMNKSINDMIRYNIIVQRKWKKLQNLNQKLALINDCTNSSKYFVQTGYLSSILSVPQNSAQLFQELYQLNLASFQLATVHLIQQKSFRQKFQGLMKGNIQKYAKKLFQNVKQVQSQFQFQQLKTYSQKNTQIKRSDLQNIQKNISNLIKTI